MNDNFKRMLKIAVELDKNISSELSKIASELIKLSDLEHDFAAEVERRDGSAEFGFAREVAKRKKRRDFAQERRDAVVDFDAEFLEEGSPGAILREIRSIYAESGVADIRIASLLFGQLMRKIEHDMRSLQKSEPWFDEALRWALSTSNALIRVPAQKGIERGWFSEPR